MISNHGIVKDSSSSNAHSGKESYAKSAEQIWRIVSKKGKSRLSTEQDGLLPTPPGNVIGTNSTNTSVNTLADDGSEDIHGQNPAQSPSEVLHASPSKGMVNSNVTSITTPSDKQNSSGDQQNEAYNYCDVPINLTPADFPPIITSMAPSSAAGVNHSKVTSCPPMGQDLQDSPSPVFSSKLAARVKSIDGNIPLVRQTCFAVPESTQFPASPSGSANGQETYNAPPSGIDQDASNLKGKSDRPLDCQRLSPSIDTHTVTSHPEVNQNMDNKLMENTRSPAIKSTGASAVDPSYPVHSSPSSRHSNGLMQGRATGFP